MPLGPGVSQEGPVQTENGFITSPVCPGLGADLPDLGEAKDFLIHLVAWFVHEGLSLLCSNDSSEGTDIGEILSQQMPMGFPTTGLLRGEPCRWYCWCPGGSAEFLKTICLGPSSGILTTDPPHPPAPR